MNTFGKLTFALLVASALSACGEGVSLETSTVDPTGPPGGSTGAGTGAGTRLAVGILELTTVGAMAMSPLKRVPLYQDPHRVFPTMLRLGES